VTHPHHTHSVWPVPPANHSYATCSFAGGDYISTGYFHDSNLGHNGQGRSHDNCVQVTSLFFDVDAVGLLDAIRVAAGQTLEKKVKDRKAVLYSATDSQVENLKAMLFECAEVLSEVMESDPTAIIDSGWGLHFHYAFEGECDPVILQDHCKRIIAHLNHRVRQVFLEHGQYPCDWPKAFDATHDVGVRLARVPGSMNTKAPGKPREVAVIVENEEVCFRMEHIEAIVAGLPVAEEPITIDVSNVPPATRATPGTHQVPSGNSRVQVDFTTLHLNDGRCWQAIADALGNGERMNVVCPFEGSSVGSAFFAKDDHGRVRMVSNATSTVYFNTFTPSPDGGGNPPPGNPPPPPPQTPPAGSPPPPPARTYAAIPVAHQRTQRRTVDGQQVTVPMGPRFPQPLHVNLCRILLEDSTFGYWYDDFRGVVMKGESPVDDEEYTRVIVTLEIDYNWHRNKPSKDAIWNAIHAAAKGNKRNPVTEYLDALEWDGTPRLNEWLFHVVYAPAAAVGCPIPSNFASYAETISRKWAISLVARAYNPGCKVDTVLGITGRQGFRKSTMFREWCPMPDLFVDTPLDMSSKDKYLTLARAWIYEDAEMASGTRAQEEAKKAFLSSKADTFRSPYSRTMQTVPRHTVIVATSNEDDVLKDKTGSRRYWLVEAPSFKNLPDSHPDQPCADIDWLTANRDQLLAEAVVAFKAGEEWWLTAEEDAQRADVNDRFTHRSVWVESAMLVFEANRGGMMNAITTSDFATAVDHELSPSQISKIGYTLSNALKQAGFRKATKKQRGRTLYYKPLPSGVDAMPGNGLSAAHPPFQTRTAREDSFRL